MFSINPIIFFVIFLPCYPEKLQKKPWEFSPDTLMPYPCSPFYADIKSDIRFDGWQTFRGHNR